VLARQAAQSIGRARSFDAQTQAHDRLERLQVFTAALSAALTLQDVFDVVARDATETAGASGSWLLLVDDDAAELRSVASSGIPHDVVGSWPTMSVDAELGPSDAFRNSTPLWFDSLDDYVDRYPASDVPGDGWVGSLAIVPLVIRGRAIGTFLAR